MELPKNPLPPLDRLLCFSVYASGLAFNQLYRGLLKRYGLTYPQFLVILALSGKNGQKVSELGEALFLESNTLTPLLKRLEQAGYISRTRDAQDERVVRIHLTAAGVTLAQEIDCVPPQVLQASSLTLDEALGLKTRLDGLAQALRAHNHPKTI